MLFAASVRSARDGTFEARARFALDLGYEKLALLSPLLEEELGVLKRLVPRDRVGVLELFLPYPPEFRPDRPSPFRLGSADRGDKEECVRAGTRTIQVADDLRIPVVLVPAVRHRASGAFDALKAVLLKLLDAADRYSVRLALELAGPGGVPDLAGARECLAEFAGAPLGVWCYTDRLEASWEALRGAIDGATVADRGEGGKPEEPGKGIVDFESLRPLLEASPIWLLDPPLGAPLESLERGMAFLRELSEPKGHPRESLPERA